MRPLTALVVLLYLVYLVALLEVISFQVVDLVGLAQGRNDWLASGGYLPMYLQVWHR